jgi:MOSC domain-containing protein YiiM
MGTRLAVGREVVLALTQHVTPCTTIAGSFTDGHYERLSVKRHPSDARVYASVEREGTIRAGDEIRVLD